MVQLKDRPLLAICGARGSQGGSVLRFAVNDGGWLIRAISRGKAGGGDNDRDEWAEEMHKLGVEVVRADYDDFESVVEAFRGAYGVFAVTNFWETLDDQKEIQQGKALVDAAKATGVQHFVWSAMDHTQNPSVRFWNSKAIVNDYLIASGVPRTSLYTVFYFENWVKFPFFAFKQGATSEDDDSNDKDNTEKAAIVADWPFLWTDGKIGGFSVKETGAFVLEALKSPEEWVGKDMRIISDIFTTRDFVLALEECSGRKIELKEVNEATFESTGESLKDVKGYGDLWMNMKHFFVHNGNPGRDLELTKRVFPQRKSMRDFVRENAGLLLPK